MNYIEFDFLVKSATPASDLLIAALADIGFESFVETENGFLAYISEKEFSDEKFSEFIQAQKSDFDFSFHKKIIPDKNWNEEWENNYHKVTVSEDCIIRAPFHAAENLKYEIIIEPKMAFGTGHHDTTLLMMRALLNLSIEKKNILDIGCGSGILSILASKRAAKSVFAVDIDEWAYNNTLENIEINNCKNISVHKGDAQILDSRKFDIILANINRNVLLQDLKIYFSVLEKKGDLLMSGFLKQDAEILKTKALETGFVFKNEISENNWLFLHFSKK
ncbi:MAG TPA: 50S ribosomal protein L11 methyltransferase [Bacteroidia bacterium]|nr:50S ribosomal protein L11 methyltransferase [Bacteroidia bacterium]